MKWFHAIRIIWTLLLPVFWVQFGWDLRGLQFHHFQWLETHSLQGKELERHLWWLLVMMPLWTLATFLMWWRT